MNSLEFTTKINRGVIHLPDEFSEYENSVARVVVTVETAEEKTARKENLFSVFERMQETGAFKSVSDPIHWQRRLRDEW